MDDAEKLTGIPERGRTDGIQEDSRPKAAFSRAHAPSPSIALMRKSVKKPDPSLKRQLKVYGAADGLHARSLVQASPTTLSSGRYRNGNTYKKSPHINHFSKRPINHQAEQLTLVKPSEAHAAIPLRPQPSPVQADIPKPADIFERAIEKASTFEQPPLKLSKKKRKALAIRWSTSAALVLVIFVGITHNMTSFKLQMASAKAGFTATIPRALPAGYSLSQLAYTRGNIGLSYRSNDGSSSYDIVQRSTSWTDHTLQTSFLDPSYPTYHTETAKGLTLHFFGNHNATWVNNGIWYTIESNGTLSEHQLIDMATST